MTKCWLHSHIAVLSSDDESEKKRGGGNIPQDAGLSKRIVRHVGGRATVEELSVGQ